MSELHTQASPALHRFVSMPPQEIMETKRRVAARPLAAFKAQLGFEPVGVLSARIVGRLMANLKKDMG